MFCPKGSPFWLGVYWFQGTKASPSSRVEETSDTQIQFNDYAPKVFASFDTSNVLELLLKVKIFGSVLSFFLF